VSARAKPSSVRPAALIAALVLVVGGGAIWFIHHVVTTADPPPKKVVQEIRVIRPPPPPPDAPPPPPPPPDEEVAANDPEPQPDPTPSNEPPPSEQLGLDAEGGAGSDGFGLVGRKGGRDLLASGGSAFAWYAGVLKSEIMDRLQDEASLRKGSYSVLVRVWVRADGTIERVQLPQSTGDRDRDRLLESALQRIGRISQSPPADMPQPVSLRIVSRA
jgi:protein TonB